MLKRELHITRKSLIIWISIIIIMFLFVFLIYPYIDSVTEDEINEMLKIFPQDFLKAFNMDIASLSNSFGWFKSEGNVILSLIYGAYATILGSSVLLKEESEKTIHFLYSKPISRNYILKNKILCGLINLFLINIISTMFIVVGLYFSNCLDLKIVLLICLTQLTSMIVFFLLGLFLSMFFRKTKQTISISLGFVFISYFLLVFSLISDKISFLKYFSIYTLSDSRGIIENGTYNISNIIISLLILIVFLFLSYKKYNKKEFY